MGSYLEDKQTTMQMNKGTYSRASCLFPRPSFQEIQNTTQTCTTGQGLFMVDEDGKAHHDEGMGMQSHPEN